MHIINTIIPVLTAFTTVVSAAECYIRGGSKNCIGPEALRKFVGQFCQSGNWIHGSWSQEFTSNGRTIKLGHTLGPISSEAECSTALNQIISQCIGKKDGGTWNSLNGAVIAIQFCQP
jgi:hypothetical protein